MNVYSEVEKLHPNRHAFWEETNIRKVFIEYWGSFAKNKKIKPTIKEQFRNKMKQQNLS